MATYSVKDTEIRVNVNASDTTATICWVGITETTSECVVYRDEESYCETVYIGENTDCSNPQHYSGTIIWHDITINYYITQATAVCPSCTKTTPPCDLISYTVDPYYVKSGDTNVNVKYEYWNYSVNDNCEIVRERITTITDGEIDTSNIPCSAENEDRLVEIHANIDECVVSAIGDLRCYVKRPQECDCEYPTSGECYDVGEIYYSPSTVPSSSADVSYYFDYKKIKTQDCEQKITFGRHSGIWHISGCSENACCKNHKVTTELSALTSDWNDKLKCDGTPVSGMQLSIIQMKDPSYSGECINECTSDVGYCVDKSTVTTYHKDSNDEWIPWGSGASWVWLDNYSLPYFGGSIKVTWEYSAFTVYDDCTTASTSGNTWEDIIDVLPDSGECDSNLSGLSINYIFKKAPCELLDSDKFPPSISGKCSGDCTEFTIYYNQDAKPCDDDCGTCIDPLDLSTSGVTGATSVTASTNGCTVELISKPEWITTTETDNTITFSLTANSGSTRQGGVTYKLNNENCYDTVIISQSGSSQNEDTPEHTDPEVQCDCNSTFDVKAISKISNGGGRLRIGSYIFDECIDKNADIDVGAGTAYTITCTNSSFSLECEGGVGFSIGQERKEHLIPDFVSNVSFDDDGFIYADVQPNTQAYERTGYLAVTYKGCVTKQISVTQEKANCAISLNVIGSVCNEEGGELTIIAT